MSEGIWTCAGCGLSKHRFDTSGLLGEYSPTACIDSLLGEIEESVEIIEGLVRQHCPERDGEVDSLALTANADALLWLEKHRRFRVDVRSYRRIIGRWAQGEDDE
jgi:hypothetical protein